MEESRRDYLESYDDSLEIWEGELRRIRDSAEELEDQLRERGKRRAQEIVDASKNGFRGESLLDHLKDAGGAVIDFATSLAEWMVELGELFLEAMVNFAKLWVELQKLQYGTGSLSDVMGALDEFTGGLAELFDHMDPLLTILSVVSIFLPPPAGPILRGVLLTIELMSLAVDLTRKLAFPDSEPPPESWGAIGFDALMTLGPEAVDMGGKRLIKSKGREVDGIMNAIRGPDAVSSFGPDIVQRHLGQQVQEFYDLKSVIEPGTKLIDLTGAVAGSESVSGAVTSYVTQPRGDGAAAAETYVSGSIPVMEIKKVTLSFDEVPRLEPITIAPVTLPPLVLN